MDKPLDGNDRYPQTVIKIPSYREDYKDKWVSNSFTNSFIIISKMLD
jgi:hypothetical protein